MGRDRWRQIEELYHAALERAPDERAAFLAEACAGDSDLRREVAELLGYDGEAEGFIEGHALAMEARQLDSEDLKTTQAPAGREIGAYRILTPLGRGGMGEVHLALDPRLGRKVALKLLPAEFAHDRERARRLEQEARAASALNHPNIITVYDIGEIDGRRYIVGELVEGETLRQRMADATRREMRQGIEPSEAIDLALQIAAALAAAHEAGIIHRDIKPENVMVRKDGLVKVLDFGLAKLTERQTPTADAAAPTQPVPSTDAGIVMGTPRYMSPEQARGEKVDARTDIFSFGVLLYEMIAGAPPFTGATPSEVIAAILRDEPPPLAHYASATPPELEHIVNRALQKERTARYPAMPELLADLKRLQRQLEREEEAPHPVSPPLSDVATARLNSAAETDEPAAPQPAGFLKRHKLSAAIALVMLLAAVAIAVYFSVQETAVDSLAVLPFVNVGANPDAEYLSDGMTDSLINSLAQARRLKVMSRSSVLRYKGKEGDAQAAGKALGVRAVLTGKVTQRGDDLIVNAELVDVRDNSHLWGEQYNHKKSDLLAVQAQLARDIAAQLRIRLSGEEQQRLTKRGTENPEAYELYLKGRYYSGTVDAKKKAQAIEYFRQAIAKDPRFALPYAGLVEPYMSMTRVNATYAIPPKEALQKAKEAAAKAVELDDTLAEAHLALAMVARVIEWDWNTAEREFQRAIALSPNLTEAHHFYAHYLVEQGRFEDGLAESRRALAFDPLDVGMNFHLGWHYHHTRQDERAVAQLQKTLGLDPNHSGAHGVLGQTYAEQGRYPEAVAELQKNQRGRDSRGHLARIYALAGRRDEAQKLLAELQEEAKHKPVSPYNIAIIYASLGEREQAFAWLEKAIAERDSNPTELKLDRIFENLRSDPRFADLLRRMGWQP